MNGTIKNRLYGADILRGIAILIVVLYHSFSPSYGWYLPWDGWFRDFNHPPSPQLLWFYPMTLGWSGVSLFFVLSGFCIHLSFLRSGSFQFSNFFWRRFWRIYPAYFLAVLVFFYFSPMGLWVHSGLKQLLTHIFLVHNFTAKTFFGINPAFWSIATEVQLYLMFPLLLAIRSHLGILHCLTVTFVLSLVWRAWAAYCWGIPDHLIAPALVSPLVTWFDWAMGAYVAERFFQHRPAFSRRSLLLCILVPLMIGSTFYKPFTFFSFSLAAAISAVLLDAALQVSWRRSSGTSALAFIGLISYSLYLWHEPRLYDLVGVLKDLTNSILVAWCLTAVLLILGSWLSFHLIEQVGIRLGDRLWPNRKPSVLPEK